MFKPIFEELSEEYTEITFVSINSDETVWINDRYSIDSIPRFLFFKRNELVYEHRGASPKQAFDFQINTKLLNKIMINEMEEGITDDTFDVLVKKFEKLVIFAYGPGDEESEFFKPYFASMMSEFPDIYFVAINAEKSPVLKSKFEKKSSDHHLYPHFLLYRDGTLQFDNHIHHPEILHIEIVDFLTDVSPIKKYNKISENGFYDLIKQHPKSLVFIFRDGGGANSIMKSLLFTIAGKFEDIFIISVDFSLSLWVAERLGIIDEDYTKFGEIGKKLPYFLMYKHGKLVHETGPIEMEKFQNITEEKLND
jgi:thiol-disulfide isomerase/thioredoxin